MARARAWVSRGAHARACAAERGNMSSRTATADLPTVLPRLPSRAAPRALPAPRDGSPPFPTAETVLAQSARWRRAEGVFEATTTPLEEANAPERARPLPNARDADVAESAVAFVASIIAALSVPRAAS